jgi:hypothetical protein
MAFNGSGVFTLAAGNPVVTGTTISSTWANNTLSDIATGLSTTITKDGQSTPTANIPMGGFKITGLGAATVNGDALRYENLTALATAAGIQAQTYTAFTTAGTSTAYTLTPSPAIGSLVANQRFRVKFNAANGAAPTLAVSGLAATALKVYNSAGSKVAPGVGTITLNMLTDVEYDGTDFVVLMPVNVADNSTQDFRLTLTTGLPVTISDVTGATTIYATPKTGKYIDLYDGTNWNRRASAEFSLALGTLTSGRPYDVFCYDNAGVPTLEFTAWTNDTTRATALTRQDGVLVKTGDATRRYLGSFYTTATTTTEDSAANRYLYNYYHRADRFMSRQEPAASWTYASATIRQANGSTSNQLNFLQGVAEDSVEAKLQVSHVENVAAGNGPFMGIGLDSTTVNSAQMFETTATSTSSYRATQHASYAGIPAAGRHALTWIESSPAAATITFYGANAGIIASGLLGRCRA